MKNNLEIVVQILKEKQKKESLNNPQLLWIKNLKFHKFRRDLGLPLQGTKESHHQ